jgi:hypothetical protein
MGFTIDRRFEDEKREVEQDEPTRQRAIGHAHLGVKNKLDSTTMLEMIVHF